MTKHSDYDVIVVGTRVAGASTAMLLARAGLRVLAVDRARFPSDTLSSHQLQVPGAALLRDWGLLDALVAAGTPSTSTITFDTGDAILRGRYPSHRGIDAMYSPRRTILDQLLVDAARAAGAEVEEGNIVDGLLTDATGVTGVRITPKGGESRDVRATLVVGADGKHSLVARTVGARAYRVRPSQSAACYGYFAGLPTEYGEVQTRPDHLIGAWPTNDGLTIVYLALPISQFPRLRTDLEANLRAAADGDLGERLRAATLVEHVRATTDLPHVMRRPYGPGWTLVGDAGLVMDPITGQGIGNALADAAALSNAVVAGLGGSRPLASTLRDVRRDRDKRLRPMYDLTAGLASFRPDPSAGILFSAIAEDPERVSRFYGVLAGTERADRFFSPANVRAMVGTRGLLRMAAARFRPARSPA